MSRLTLASQLSAPIGRAVALVVVDVVVVVGAVVAPSPSRVG